MNIVDVENIIKLLEELIASLTSRDEINGIKTFSEFLNSIRNQQVTKKNLELLQYNISGIQKYGSFSKNEIEIMNEIWNIFNAY